MPHLVPGEAVANHDADSKVTTVTKLIFGRQYATDEHSSSVNFSAIKRGMFHHTKISIMQYPDKNVVIVNSGDNPTIFRNGLVSGQLSEIIIKWDRVLILFIII